MHSLGCDFNTYWPLLSVYKIREVVFVIPWLPIHGQVAVLFGAYILLEHGAEWRIFPVWQGTNYLIIRVTPLIARFMGPTWGPSGADRTQVGSMLAPWTLLSGSITNTYNIMGLLLQSVVLWWRHDRETFSTLLAPCKGKHRSAADLIHKGPTTRGFGIFFIVIMLSRERCWTNNRFVSDLGRNGAHVASM